MAAGNPREHVSERFGRLLALHRKPDGVGWGGRDLQAATGVAVTLSYVSNLENGRIGNPGLAKLEAIAGALGLRWSCGSAGEVKTGARGGAARRARRRGRPSAGGGGARAGA